MNNILKYGAVAGGLYVLSKVVSEGKDMVQIQKKVRTEVDKVKFSWTGGILGKLWITLLVKVINPTDGTMNITHPNVYLHTVSKDAKKDEYLNPNYQILVSEVVNDKYEIPANGEVYLKLIHFKVSLFSLPKLLKVVDVSKIMEMFKNKDLSGFMELVRPGLWTTADFKANGIDVSIPNRLT